MNRSPTESTQKSKLSSDASFLLDFSFPCKFTIFTFSTTTIPQTTFHHNPFFKFLVLNSWHNIHHCLHSCLRKMMSLTVQAHEYGVSLQLRHVDRINLITTYTQVYTQTIRSPYEKEKVKKCACRPHLSRSL